MVGLHYGWAIRGLSSNQIVHIKNSMLSDGELAKIYGRSEALIKLMRS